MLTRQKANIFDVAELAGVSIKTVSRVVNGEPHVRPSTKKLVDRAISELGYKPYEPARRLVGLRAKKTA